MSELNFREYFRKHVINLWGTEKQFYDELELFHKRHQKQDIHADYIEYENESGLPTKAVYIFRPMQVAVEDNSLKQAIRKIWEEDERTR